MEERRKFRRKDAELSHQKILDVATRTFSEKGFDGARIEEIARQARVSKRLLYVHFGNKEALYRAVLDSQLDRLLRLRRRPEERSADPIEEAKIIIRRFFIFLSENADFVRLFNWESLARGRSLHLLLFEKLSQALGELRELLATAIAQGRLRSDIDPQRVLLSISSLCLGQLAAQPVIEASWHKDFSSPEAREAILREILDLIFKGIQVPAPHPDVPAQI